MIGNTFHGIVSGMIEKGFFVELNGIGAEGLIKFDQLSEPFQVEKGRLKASGRKTGRIIHLGTKVVVKLLSADLDARQIEMELIELLE